MDIKDFYGVEILSRASIYTVTHINIVTQHYLCIVKDNLNIVLVLWRYKSFIVARKYVNNFILTFLFLG